MNFQFLDIPLTADLLLPAQVQGSTASSQARLDEEALRSAPMGSFVFLTRSNQLHVLRQGEWVPSTPRSADEARALAESFLPRTQNWMGLLFMLLLAASGYWVLLKSRKTNHERR